MNRKDCPERSYITENSWDTNYHLQLLKEGIKYNLYIHLLHEFHKLLREGIYIVTIKRVLRGYLYSQHDA